MTSIYYHIVQIHVCKYMLIYPYISVYRDLHVSVDAFM